MQGDCHRHISRRHRNRRRIQYIGQRYKEDKGRGSLPSTVLKVQDLHHRRSPYAEHIGLQRTSQDNRGTAGVHHLHLCNYGNPEGSGNYQITLPGLPLPADPPGKDRGVSQGSRIRDEYRSGRGRPLLDKQGGNGKHEGCIHSLRSGCILLRGPHYTSEDQGETQSCRILENSRTGFSIPLLKAGRRHRGSFIPP